MKKLFIILGLAGLITGCSSRAKLEPGTYEGQGQGYNEDSTINVKVTIGEEGKITAIETTHGDTEEIAGPCIDQLTKDIIENDSVDVDIVAGATYTSQGFLDAVEDAMSKK